MAALTPPVLCHSLSSITLLKSVYGDGTWVIKINNSRVLPAFSRGKTPGAALLRLINEGGKKTPWF